jgi:hypothetical protein
MQFVRKVLLCIAGPLPRGAIERLAGPHLVVDAVYLLPPTITAYLPVDIHRYF